MYVNVVNLECCFRPFLLDRHAAVSNIRFSWNLLYVFILQLIAAVDLTFTEI
jgi:hypothetical protein